MTIGEGSDTDGVLDNGGPPTGRMTKVGASLRRRTLLAAGAVCRLGGAPGLPYLGLAGEGMDEATRLLAIGEGERDRSEPGVLGVVALRYTTDEP